MEKEKIKSTGLLQELNGVPENIRHIHLMGICGTGMSSLAGILREKGFSVTGSDGNIYPPVSTLLESLCIPLFEGYDPAHLYPNPDLVIVGNVITTDNPQAVELSNLKIPYLSFPQAIRHFAIKDKYPVVITGTHGKTTTSSLAAWILEKAGRYPGFMIGGIPLNFNVNFKIGKGPFFIIEGDEYDTAFFDKGPKFLHYNPKIAVLTSIEFDHADIYRDLDHVTQSFRRLVDLMSDKELLIANGDSMLVKKEVERAGCPVALYGFSENLPWRADDIRINKGLTRLTIKKEGRKYVELSTQLYGRHNISNILSAVVLSDFLEIPGEVLKEALMEFKGVKRRQEIVGEKYGILVLDDFAHHPTAVRETVTAVRERYEDRRLVAIFEPRSNSSRRRVFQKQYALSFDGADLVMIPEPPLMDKIPENERFSSKCLVEDLVKRGIRALYFSGTDQMIEEMTRESMKGDVFLFMSNGGFDNVPRRFLDRLEISGNDL
ncbi:MAG: UDP-N-acetylmuramate:L-alanyl-gamma-D-glutamyl-meso-diaminopimelate ligase [Deltaproteobacteria bacterium]|nr:UDP-N-acetylmuramate:L-alanyl-gamma-D-glutamyl-meso-diaminopimelate ligase [Deltaproteobacteria bacterium]